MKKKERGANTAFPLVFFLRSTCQNADLERKINKKVILYIIHRMRNFPPASKQKLLFPEAFLIERTWSSPAPRKGSVGVRPSADPTVQGWLVWTCSSRLPPRNSLFFSLLAFLVILLGWECPMMSALFLGKRKSCSIFLKHSKCFKSEPEPWKKKKSKSLKIASITFHVHK